jgi:hypothetical protein
LADPVELPPLLLAVAAGALRENNPKAEAARADATATPRV